MALRFLSSENIDGNISAGEGTFVSGSSGFAIRLDSANSSTDNDLRFAKGGVDYGAIQTGGASNDLEFYVHNGSNWIESFRVQRTTGNVGIGLSPASSVVLDVKEPDSSNDLILGLTAGTGSRAQIRSVVQTSTESALSFHTTLSNSTQERFRILNTGAFSLGNSGTNYGTAGQVLTSNGNAAPYWSTPSSGTITGSGTANYVTKFTGTTAIGNSSIYDTGSYTSIGGTDTSGRLTVHSTGDVEYLTLNTTATTNKRVRLQFTQNDNAGIEIATDYAVNNSSNIYIYDRVAGGSAWLFVSGSEAWFQGNLGVGMTSNPATKLDVAGTIRAGNITSPTSGAGTELIYNPSVDTGYVLAYDRGNSVYKFMQIVGSTIILESSGTVMGKFNSTFSYLTNSNSGNYEYTNLGGRLLTSNGTGWSADGRDPILTLSSSGNSDDTNIANSIGLNLYSNSNDNNTYSPAIAFSGLSNSSNYASTYGMIIGKKTGQGVDSNWNAGELHFFTGKVSAYMQSTPDMLIDSSGRVGIGVQPSMGLHVADTKGALFGPANAASTYISPTDENTINGGYGFDTDTADVWLNYRGYQDGFTRFRDTRIGNGKGSAVVHVDGSANNMGIGKSPDSNYALDINEKLRITAGMAMIPTTSTLYATDGTLSYYATSNAVYLNGAGASGWLRLNASGVENDRNSINIYGSAGDYMNFRTANSTRLTIDSNGNFGFNNTSPQFWLHSGTTVAIPNSRYLNFAGTNAYEIPQSGFRQSFVCSYNDSSGGDQPRTIGIILHNESTQDNNFTPMLGFGAQSNSNNYSQVVAGIAGKRLGQAGDSNWSAGELWFWTGRSDTIGGASQGLPRDYPAMVMSSTRHIGIGTNTPTQGKLEIQQTATTAALWVQTGGTSSSYTIADFRTGTNFSALRMLGNGDTIFGDTLSAKANRINSGYSTAANDSDIWLNYEGYQNDLSYYRDFRVGNGRGSQIAIFDGSSSRVGIMVSSRYPDAKFEVYHDGGNGGGNLTQYGILAKAGGAYQATIGAHSTGDGYANLNLSSDVSGQKLWHISKRTNSDGHRLEYFYYAGNFISRFAFFTNGDFHADGDIVAYSTTISDASLKDNVVTIDNALDKVKQLRGVSYKWNSGPRNQQKDLGVIAQEVEKVLPEIVYEEQALYHGSKQVKSVDYEKLTAVLIEAVKELQQKVEKLEKKKCCCK